MKKVHSGPVASAMLLLMSLPSAAQDGRVSMQEIHQCRDHSDAEKRLTCYDQIGKPAPVETAPVVTADAETPDTTTAETDAAQDLEPGTQGHEPADDFGLPKTENNYESFRATVARCSEAKNRMFYFYLDNGQVWKYVGNKRLRYKNCNSPATLSEDGFGFTLQMDEGPTLRVLRVK